jgi:uncharacterized membrane protein YuzA (DUF378 family)
MKALKGLALVLVVIGALNWGLWGFFQFDLVAWLFQGNTSMASRVIYSLIGLAGVSMLCCFGRCCKALCCSSCKKCENGCKCGSKCKCGPGCGCCK